MANDRYRAMRYEHPDRIPISCSILPSAWIRYRDELSAVVNRFPELFGDEQHARDYDAVSGTYVAGTHTDVWGCVWQNVHHGQEAIVTGHPLPERSMVRGFRAPSEDAGLPHGFMYLRLQDLRGFEELMIDFAEEPPELAMLIDTVLAYNVRQVELHLNDQREPGTIVYFGDDLGMQQSLPMGPQKWRTWLRPCFERIFAPVKAAGHYVFLHSDGHIHEIIPDLVECGVDVINPQFRANGLDNLSRVCKGTVCVSLDLDRQLFPFCTPSDIDDHVRESVEKLGAPEGGLWLQAEIDDGVPLENVEAICHALVKYATYYS